MEIEKRNWIALLEGGGFGWVSLRGHFFLRLTRHFLEPS